MDVYLSKERWEAEINKMHAKCIFKKNKLQRITKKKKKKKILWRLNKKRDNCITEENNFNYKIMWKLLKLYIDLFVCNHAVN